MNLAGYWEQRYASGGTSGAGSTGDAARHKADVINRLLLTEEIASVVDWGCGDGVVAELIDPGVAYLGVDVAPTAVRWCVDRLSDRGWAFLLDRPGVDVTARAELALSLDVMFHLVDDGDFDRYVTRLFASATRFVLIHSTAYDDEPVGHMHHRAFLSHILRTQPGWDIVQAPADARTPGFYLYRPR